MIKLIFIIIYIIVSIHLLADGVQPIGSGSETDPYQVENLDNLLWISTNNSSWDSHFIQIAHIDASSTENWNDGEGFLPIGDLTINFTGTYNGQSNQISNLFFNRPEAFNQGLFGRITESAIENVILSNFLVYGNFNAGGVIAHAIYSDIINCSAQGEVYGSTNLGGLIGIAENCVISNCSSNSYVFGDEFIGSLIGQCYQSIANVCYSLGSVEGIGNLGGWSGLIFDSWVRDCFSHSNVSPSMSAGGFAGTIMQNSIIDKCYSNGYIDGGEADIGGFAGMIISATVENSFWDMDSSGQNESAGGTGKTTSEMQMVSTFTDLSSTGLEEPWDFVGYPNDDIGNADYWDINDSYPFLTFQLTGADDELILSIPEVSIINYPNPFNPSTTISFNIETSGEVELSIFNVRGQKIRTLLQQHLSTGTYEKTWDGLDSFDQQVSSGVYLISLVFDNRIRVVENCLLLK